MEIKTHIIKAERNPYYERGYGNGYIGVPPGHPWFGMGYNDVPANVHGGLTYDGNKAPGEPEDGYWWLGFDTAHYGDTPSTCPESYVNSEVERLKRQAEEALA